jgi:hypothetical protein
MGEAKQWNVYQNLNDKADVIVASNLVMVAAIYNHADGPFDSERDARKRADEIRNRVEPL